MNVKKVLLLFILAIASWSAVEAQTYYYKYLYSVNEVGQKFLDDSYQSQFNTGKDVKYFTFSNNMSYVSFTDKNGISKDVYFQYRGKSNGIYEYVLEEVDLQKAMGNPIKGIPPTQNAYRLGAAYMEQYSLGGGTIMMFFSSDYERLNIRSNSGTHVLQRASMPDSQRRPDTLY